VRTAYLYPVALVLAACAHRLSDTSSRTRVETAGTHDQEQSAESARAEHPPPSADRAPSGLAIGEQPHPVSSVGTLRRPPARAARGPRDLDSSSAAVSIAEPPPQATGSIKVAVESTDTPSSVEIAPPRPVSRKELTAPLQDDSPKPPLKLGADITRADAELRERVQRALLNSSSLSYTAKHVRVDVAQSGVTLRGEARTAHERSELDRIVRSLPGVKSLNNEVALINRPTTTRTP
jgi:hypothetical protein